MAFVLLESFDEFTNGRWYLFDYQKNIDLWAKLGPVQVFPFEYISQASSIGYEFLKLVASKEFPDLVNKVSPFANKSLPFPILAYKLLLNRRSIAPARSKYLIEKLTSLLDDNIVLNLFC